MMVLLNQHVVVLGSLVTKGPSTIELWEREKLKARRSVYWFASWRVKGRLEKLGAKGLGVLEMV